MADMQVVTVRNTGRDRKFAYEYSVSLSAPGVSAWVLIPEDVNYVDVSIMTEIEAYAESTNELLRNVQEDSGSIVGEKWSRGTVYGNSTDRSTPVTAVRLVQVGVGSCKMLVRSQ